MVRITERNRDELRKLKHGLNLPTYDSVISHIMTKDLDEHSIASYERVMVDTVPIILTGLPGSGKTHFLQNEVIPKLSNDLAIFVVDVHNEYGSLGLQAINLGDFFGLNFKENNGRFRLVPSYNVDVCRSEIDSVFRHLIMFRELLKNWVILLEEGQRFGDSQVVRSFVAEARKHTRKVVVITHQVGQFKGLGRILRSAFGMNG